MLVEELEEVLGRISAEVEKFYNRVREVVQDIEGEWVWVVVLVIFKLFWGAL